VRKLPTKFGGFDNALSGIQSGYRDSVFDRATVTDKPTGRCEEPLVHLMNSVSARVRAKRIGFGALFRFDDERL